MRPRSHRFVIAGILAGTLLVPALLWSGRLSIGAERRDASSKLPEISTIGPESVRYVLAPQERAKFSQPACESMVPLEHFYESPDVFVEDKGPYEGPTSKELEKLAAWEWRASELAKNGAPRVTTPPRDPVSTVESVPRVPGIEGMTSQERAKLEAYLREGGRR